jgi:peptide/nickel transport system permease protein
VIRFVLRRFLWAIPTIAAVTFLVYVALRIGTDPVKSFQRLNPRASTKQLQDYRDLNGLYNGFGGYVKGYFQWLGRFITGHWSKSIKGQYDVWPRLQRALANSIRLGLTASIIGILVGNTLGVMAALRPGRLRDTTVNSAALVGISVPPFVVGFLLQLILAIYWKKWFGHTLFPTSGIYPPGHKGFDLVLMIKYMTLPVIVVAIQSVSTYARYMRSSLLDVSNSDFLRTARAKGVSERRVLVRHALRNALIPVTTLAFLEIGGVVGGLIITEFVFAYPGMGKFFLDAYESGDFPQLMPWMVIIIVSVILFNLLADVIYAVLDPRIRLD